LAKKKPEKKRKPDKTQQAATPEQRTLDTAPRPRGVSPGYYGLIICAVLVAITLAVYWQTFDFDFVNYDDPLYVTDNPYTQAGLSVENVRWAFTTGHAANWHPVTWLSYMLDVQLFGVNAGVHHFVNVLLHIANTLLVFLVLYRMTALRNSAKALWQSAFVAALFAIHPLHVESVAWIAERKDVLSTLFWLLTMAAYVYYCKRPGVMRYLLVALPFALGLMAKPMLVTLPAALLLLDYWPLGRLDLASGSLRQAVPKAVRLVLEKVPLLILAVLSSVATILAQGSRGGVVPYDEIPMPVRIGNALVGYVQYLIKTFRPVGLAIFYPHLRDAMPPWQPIAALCVLAVVTVLVVLTLQRLPYLPVGWFWYLGTLVPVIGIVQVGDQALADRYTYVPLIGVFIMAAWGMTDLAARLRLPKPVLPAAACALVAALGVCAHAQASHWQDSITLFDHALKVTSGNYMAHKAIAVTDDAERYEEAVVHCRKAIELDPQDSAPYYNLGNALYKLGKAGDAIEAYREAIKIKPDYLNAHYNLGNVLAEQRHLDDAIALYGKVLELDPRHAGANNNLGTALVLQGKLEQALPKYRTALDIDPDYVDALCNLGYTLSKLGKLDDAVQAYEKALHVDPACERARKALDKIREHIKR